MVFFPLPLAVICPFLERAGARLADHTLSAPHVEA